MNPDLKVFVELIPENGSGCLSANDDDNVLMLTIVAKGKAARELWELYQKWDEEEK